MMNSEDKYYCYILYSPSSNKYYIGQTKDLRKRVESHNLSSLNSYTSRYRPWIVKWFVELNERSKALKMEKYLKKKNRDFIRRVLIDRDLESYIIDRFR